MRAWVQAVLRLVQTVNKCFRTVFMNNAPDVARQLVSLMLRKKKSPVPCFPFKRKTLGILNKSGCVLKHGSVRSPDNSVSNQNPRIYFLVQLIRGYFITLKNQEETLQLSEKLLSIYCLWDVTCGEYKNRNKKTCKGITSGTKIEAWQLAYLI